MAKFGEEGEPWRGRKKDDDDDEEEEDVNKKEDGDDNVPTYKNAGLVSGNGGDLRPRRNLDVHFTHWAFVALSLSWTLFHFREWTMLKSKSEGGRRNLSSATSPQVAEA